MKHNLKTFPWSGIVDKHEVWARDFETELLEMKNRYEKSAKEIESPESSMFWFGLRNMIKEILGESK